MADEESGKPPDGQGCRHYWVIQPATGPISPGLCQTCGLTREFKNYVEASTWGDDRSSDPPKRVSVAEIEEEMMTDKEEEERPRLVNPRTRSLWSQRN